MPSALLRQGVFQCFHEYRKGTLQSLANFTKFNNVDSSLAAFDLADPRLRPAYPSSELFLSQTRLLSRRYQLPKKYLVLL